MNSITPVRFTTPDGKERNLVWRLGSQRLIVDWLGCPFQEALKKYDYIGALPELLYACMYDDEMQPPADLSLNKLRATLDPAKQIEYITAFFSAVDKGKTPKNDIEALIRDALGITSRMDSGSSSAPSPVSASDSTGTSSGVLPNGSLTPTASSTSTSETNSGAPLV